MVINKYETTAAMQGQKSMQVKMFVHADPKSSEAEVNNWLGSQIVQVHHIGQSQCERNGNLLFLITVFYTELPGQ